MKQPDGGARLARNTGYAAIANAVPRAAGLLVFILLGRLAGLEAAGSFSLALGALAVLTTFFAALDDLLIREIVSDPERTAAHLASYGVLRVVVAAVAALLFTVGLSRFSHLDGPQTAVVAVILSTAVIEALAALGQAPLYARGNFALPLIAVCTTAAFRVGAGALILFRGGGELLTALVWPVGALLGGILMLFGAVKGLQPRAGVGHANTQARALIARYARLMPVFGLMGLLSGLEYQLDVMFLARFWGAAEVAIYSAAAAIVAIPAVLSQGHRMALFPTLVKQRREAPHQLRQTVMRSVRTLAAAGFVAAIVIALLAPWLVRLVFGEGFEATIPVLRILAWNIIFIFTGVPLVRLLLAAADQAFVSRALAVSLTINVTGNWLLAPAFGARGSALVRLVSSAAFLSIIALRARARLRVEERIGESATI